MIKVVFQASLFLDVHILLEVDVNKSGFKRQRDNQTYHCTEDLFMRKKIFNLKIIPSIYTYTHDEIEKG